MHSVTRLESAFRDLMPNANPLCLSLHSVWLWLHETTFVKPLFILLFIVLHITVKQHTTLLYDWNKGPKFTGVPFFFKTDYDFFCIHLMNRIFVVGHVCRFEWTFVPKILNCSSVDWCLSRSFSCFTRQQPACVWRHWDSIWWKQRQWRPRL